MSPNNITPANSTQQIELFQPDAFQTPFDRIAHTDDNGEYWSARELMRELDYATWQKFSPVITKAIRACHEAAIARPEDQFARTVELIEHGKGGKRKVESYRLSRYACYLIAMNGDSSKRVIAEAQTYFAIKARETELRDQYEREQRLLKHNTAVTAYINAGHSAEWSERRVDSKESVKALNGAAMLTHETNSPNYGSLHSAINRGLFDMTKAEIVARLGLQAKDAEKYRDHLGHYALDTLKRVNEASARKMRQYGRALTDEEQTAIVQEVVRILAHGMYELAAYVGVDFLSGAELDENGNPAIDRNVPLFLG